LQTTADEGREDNSKRERERERKARRAGIYNWLTAELKD
jgi:hypothetical protein